MGSDNQVRRQSRWVELFDPETYYPVLERLSSYLTIADFLVLCQVCRRLAGLKDCILRKISSVNIRLRDFVDDPTMFRSQLGNCGALISGSFALNLFELSRYKVLYLDVFVRDGPDTDHFTNYIRETEKYQRNNPEVRTTPRRAIYSSSARPGIKLRITRTSGSPIREILTSSQTTACVNFITWNRAYSIFPLQTLINHRFYPLRPLDDDFGSKLNELAHLGWTTRDIMWPDFAGVKTRKLAGLRRVGDVSTLIIPLDTDFVLVPSTPDFVIEYAQFEVVDKFSKNVNSQDLDYGAGTSRLEQASLPLFLQSQPTPFQAPVGNPPHSCPFLEIRARELASPAVRHVYTTASTEWHGYAEKRLQRWAWVELYKLEPAKRPSQSPNGIPLVPGISIPQAFEVSWDYADDQIPEWYREWEQTRVG